MKALMFVGLLLAAGLFGSCAKGDPNEQIFKSYDFPGHAGLIHLCQKQHQQGESNHPGYRSYAWDVFISASTPSELIADYREKLKGESFAKTEDGAGGMFFKREANLYIFPIDTDGLYGNLDITCGQTPPADARSRIVLVKKDQVLTQRISPKKYILSLATQASEIMGPASVHHSFMRHTSQSLKRSL